MDRVVRSFKPLLPTGFTRRHRSWRRSEDGITCSVDVRNNIPGHNDDYIVVLLSAHVDGRPWGLDADLGQIRVPPVQFGAWWPHTVADETRVLAEVHAALTAYGIPWITERWTPQGYLAQVNGDQICSPRLVEALLAFGHRADLVSVLGRGPHRAPTREFRSLDLDVAENALNAYTCVGEPLSAEWRSFVESTVKAFRGRPPKRDRAIYERVVGLLAAEP